MVEPPLTKQSERLVPTIVVYQKGGLRSLFWNVSCNFFLWYLFLVEFNNCKYLIIEMRTLQSLFVWGMPTPLARSG
jgi:hypothetical protein